MGHSTDLSAQTDLPRNGDILRNGRVGYAGSDGDGYPDGLAGEEIPQLSRIISVADTYDAMRSKRPYREGVSHVEALAELLRVRGSQLDPRCVDAFTAVFAESGTRLLDEQAAA